LAIGNRSQGASSWLSTQVDELGQQPVGAASVATSVAVTDLIRNMISP
jgi:hypothetical protein